MSNQTAVTIKRLLSLGWSIIPIRRATKKPCLDSWEEYGICQPELDEWRAWFRRWSDCGIAVVYGGCITEPGQQLVCVDTDNEEQEAWVQAQEPPATPTVQTADGLHRYFIAPAGLQHFNGTPDRPEVRAGTHYSLLPPSIHPTGVVYGWLDGLSVFDVPLAELPPWGCELMRGAPERQQERPRTTQQQPDLTEGEDLLEGGRNWGLFRVCARWRAANVPEYQLRTGAQAYNAQHCKPPLPDSEVASVVRSVLRYPAGTSVRQQVRERKQQDAQPEPPEGVPPLPDDAEAQAAAAVDSIPVEGEYQPAAPPARPPLAKLQDISEQLIAEFEEYRNRPRTVRGLRTGFPTLDGHFLGFSDQQLIIVQGPSGYGKTLFASHCLFATALAEYEHKAPAWTAMFMLEASRTQLTSAYLGYRYKVPREYREPGASVVTPPEWQRAIDQGYYDLTLGLPIAVHDDCRDIGEIETNIRNLSQEGPLAGVIIDHAQEVETPRGRSRHEELNMVSLRLRDLSEKLRVPIMLLSQTTLKDGNYEPEYSKSLRQKASLCFVVTRGQPGQTREEQVQSNVTRVICDKSRWQRVPPPLVLLGDTRTGRLWEQWQYPEEDARENQPAVEEREQIWHDN